MNFSRELEPRRRPALKAVRHGITGQVLIMTDEDRIAHDDLLLTTIEELEPKGEVELQYVIHIAGCDWRLRRYSAIQDQLPLAAAGNPRQLAKSLKSLQAMRQRLLRMRRDYLAMLRKLQADRKMKDQTPLEHTPLEHTFVRLP